MSLNIAIIGAVSAGKSTLLNALFANTYSDMKIKRTTMIPQVYVCDNKASSSPDDIRLQNRIKNEEFQTNLNSVTISEIIHHVPKLYDFFELPNDMVYSIYDIPGLNDAKTKNLYFDYIKANFHKFDIIIYVVDINSAMNTSDEVDILKHVIDCINENRQKYDIYTYMYILVNKCDDMELNEEDLDSVDIDLIIDDTKCNNVLDSPVNTNDINVVLVNDIPVELSDPLNNNKQSVIEYEYFKDVELVTDIYHRRNKCDNVILDNDKRMLSEHLEMLEQVKNVVSGYIKSEIDCKIIPVSVEDWYIYRMCKNGNLLDLEDKYKNKLSHAIQGKQGKPVTLRTLKRKSVINKINKLLECSNYDRFKDLFIEMISTRHTTFYLNHVKYDIKNMWTKYDKANFSKLDQYHDQLSKCSISTEIITTAMVDYCKEFIKMAQSYLDSSIANTSKISRTWVDSTKIYQGTKKIYKLSRKYKFETDIHIVQLLLINYFEGKIKGSISFLNFSLYFYALNTLLADSNNEKIYDKLTDYLTDFLPNYKEYSQEISRRSDTILNKFRELISVYKVKVTLVYILLTILTRHYSKIPINSSTGYQIKNYWNNIIITSNNFDITIKMLLFVKYYFDKANVTSIFELDDTVYDFYLEETLINELLISKYSVAISVLV